MAIKELVVKAPLFPMPTIAKQTDRGWIDATEWSHVDTEVLESFEIADESSTQFNRYEKRKNTAQSCPRKHPLCMLREIAPP